MAEYNPVGTLAKCGDHPDDRCFCMLSPDRFGPPRPLGKFTVAELIARGYRLIWYSPDTGIPSAVDMCWPGDRHSLPLSRMPDYSIIECDLA